MTHVTSRLTAKIRDQLRNPTLGNRVWATFFTITCTATHRATQQLSLATTISRIAQHICMNGTLRRDFPDVARFCPPVCRITSRAGAWCICLRVVRVELRRVHVQSDAVPAGYRRQRVRQHAHGHRLRPVCTPCGVVWYGKCRAL